MLAAARIKELLSLQLRAMIIMMILLCRLLSKALNTSRRTTMPSSLRCRRRRRCRVWCWLAGCCCCSRFSYNICIQHSVVQLRTTYNVVVKALTQVVQQQQQQQQRLRLRRMAKNKRTLQDEWWAWSWLVKGWDGDKNSRDITCKVRHYSKRQQRM